MAEKYLKRVFGAVGIKSKLSNYNADFTGQPRTLPNGKVYATDKALKYTIRNYMKEILGEEVFFYRRVNDKGNPLTLDETFEVLFYKPKKGEKDKITANLLKCIDIRLFGATYAGADNISIHGPVQISHGLNKWEDNIFTEQITSPFRNSGEKSKGAEQTTIGRQSLLEEGHYIHHFSVNPKNLDEALNIAGSDAINITDEDIEKLKQALVYGATYHDSTSKSGTENEFMIWVELKEDSKLVLPSFIDLIKVYSENDKIVYDLADVKKILDKYESEIEKIEIYRNVATIELKNNPAISEMKEI